MTNFADGPAKGVILELQRAPIYLRVTRSTKGDWDALDQPDDRPGDTEAVFVYRREVGSSGSVHLDYTDKQGRRRGKTLTTADYRFVQPQPDNAILRDNARWAAWAREQHAKGVTPC